MTVMHKSTEASKGMTDLVLLTYINVRRIYVVTSLVITNRQSYSGVIVYEHAYNNSKHNMYCEYEKFM